MMHSTQWVAPTPNAIVLGSSPGGQKRQLTPSELNLPGGQIMQLSWFASGALPASHGSHASPAALAQPWAVWSNSFGSLQFRHSERSVEGCCPTEHRSQTPLRPAVPDGHSLHAVWMALGSEPSAQTPQTILSLVNLPYVTPPMTSSTHSSHTPRRPAVPTGHGWQPEWSSFGSVPSAHGPHCTRSDVNIPYSTPLLSTVSAQASHKTPSELYRPLLHGSQAVLALFGCCAALH